MSHGINKRNPILRCALADLWHEWPLNLCVALGIAALLFPLAVLYGLKFGAVSVLENRLMQDPRSRELRPAASGFFTKEWLAEKAENPEVAFVVGLPKAIASTVAVSMPDGELEATILPTSAGDPLLDSGGLMPPDSDGCIISASLAREVNLQVGALLSFSILRKEENQWREESAGLRVAGILPDFALDYPALLVLPETADAVEDFFDGLPVPRFGWKGSAALARPAYDGALLIVQSGKDRTPTIESLGDRISGTGFTTIKKSRAPWANQDAKNTIFYLSNSNSLVDDTNMDLLRVKFQDEEILIVPWLTEREAILSSGDKKKTVGLRAWSGELAGAGLPPLIATESDHALPWQAAGRSGGKVYDDETTLVWSGIAGALEIPIQITAAASIEPDVLWLPGINAGILRRALERGVELQDGKFVYSRRGYASFRMAARTINDVIPLQQRLEADGLRVIAETQRIADIQFLEKQLAHIFALFAAVAGAGAVTSLIAVAFSAAERKKRVLAFLQILGAGKGRTARFPLYQGVVLSLVGAAIAWGAHTIFSWAVNRTFAGRLLPGERLSELPIEATAIAVGVLLLISLVCYVLVLPRFIGMPLGEAAREP